VLNLQQTEHDVTVLAGCNTCILHSSGNQQNQASFERGGSACASILWSVDPVANGRSSSFTLAGPTLEQTSIKDQMVVSGSIHHTVNNRTKSCRKCNQGLWL